MIVPVEKEGETLDITWAPFDIPILSYKCADIFRAFAKDTVEFIPTTLANGRQQLHVLNIRSVIDSIDYARSRMSVYPPTYYRKDLIGKPQSVFQLSLIPETIEGCDVFRLKHLESAIVVSRNLLQELIGS